MEETSMTQVVSRAGFFLGFIFNPEDEDSMLLQNVVDFHQGA
jgi:hypothetical protein